MADTTVWFNPQCSKCRTLHGMLEERGIAADYVRYLDDTPAREEIERVLAMVGSDDPRAIMRTGEAIYRELDLANAGRDALLAAMVEHPILIERPILIVGNRAVVARPPERALELLGE